MKRHNKLGCQLTESDIISFLKNAYFGAIEDIVSTAAHSAYLDLNRTIDFRQTEAITDRIKGDLRNEAANMIMSDIKNLLNNPNVDSVVFDEWHDSLCKRIISTYGARQVCFHYGQAQKWINMTMKYFCVLNLSEANRIVHLMHLPIDSNVFERADDLLSINYPSFRWSRMTEGQYKGYLASIRDALSKQTPSFAPMIWEFKNWER